MIQEDKYQAPKEFFSTRHEPSRSNLKYITELREQTAWFFFCGKSGSEDPDGVWQWLRGRWRKFRAVAQIPVHTAELTDQRRLLTAHPIHLQFLLPEAQLYALLTFSFCVSWTQNISIAITSVQSGVTLRTVSDCAVKLSGCSGFSCMPHRPGSMGMFRSLRALKWRQGSSQHNLDS